MERTVEQHVMQYRCQAHFSASHCQVLLSGNPDEASLRQLIRGILREELELQKAYLVCRQPSAASLSDVLREEIRQALQPTLVQPSIPATTYDVVAAQVMTYSDVLRKPSNALKIVSFRLHPGSGDSPAVLRGSIKDHLPG